MCPEGCLEAHNHPWNPEWTLKMDNYRKGKDLKADQENVFLIRVFKKEKTKANVN